MKSARMALFTVLALAAACLFTQAGAAIAGDGSLWANNGSMFADRKASGIGDIVTVRVNEAIKDKDEGKVTSSKTTEEDVAGGRGFILEFITSLGFGSSSSTSSNVKLERTKSVTARFACIVTEVLPNGNMVIEGDRILVNGAEKMNVRFSGVVRPQDVSAANEIQSINVANAEIWVSGRGAVSTTSRPGVISQVLKALF
ncbi:flagellar L-ring protein [Synergistales bacterium]|nr:flagellar L-ring protein [Synergistales bacterium]GHV54008.1 flagellar L-ring protein [Synergistales bacterium]